MSEALAPSAPEETHGLTWQKAFLGDWSRYIRDPLDILRLIFIGASLVWGLTGHPWTQVLGASLVLILARAASLPRFYDFSLIVVMTLVGWGEALGIYDSWRYYDNVVHTTVPLLLTGVVYVFMIRLQVMPELRELVRTSQRVGFFLTVMMMGMAIGAAWEIVEWTLDTTTGSHLVISTTDTATDLIWDTIGSAGAATILVLWSLGNHSLRRRPGVALAHKPFRSFLSASTR